MNAINTYMDDPSPEKLNLFINSGYLKIGSYEIQDNFNAFRSEYNNLIHSNPTKAIQLSVDFINQYKIDFLNLPVVVGASGAVFGILLAFGMMFPNALIYVYFAIPVKAKYFVMIYGALELFSGIFDTGSNVAHFAHLGGMIFGYILILYWKKR